MSATRTVPAVVPSDVQSSLPEAPSSAVKNKVSPKAMWDAGLEPARPGKMSLISVGVDIVVMQVN
jgi:hypothetical protein